ncbi:MAG: transporter substrate-binding domain-containing protein [Treponema sp.]|nr:transporter substrate-binding domain-containing protein [Treponema sp.]MCL2237216.1 transporter substrate-binding domain-containing protein [Treponema sp.]
MSGCKACLLIFIFSLFFVSCESPNRAEGQAAMGHSPLEAVLGLKEENKKFENTRSRSVQAHQPEIKNILDRGYIVFSMSAAEEKPFYYIEETSGELIGLDVEIAYTIANILRIKAVILRNSSNHDGVISAVTNNEADIAISRLGFSLRRAELVRFTQPYVTIRQALLFNRLEFAKIGAEDTLPHFVNDYYGPLGIMENSPYQVFAQENFPNAQAVKFNSMQNAADALFRSRITAIYNDEIEILAVNAQKANASLFAKTVFIGNKNEYIVMAVSPNAPQLQEWLNVFLNEYISVNRRELSPEGLAERHYGGRR